jgi:hypothetical protein
MRLGKGFALGVIGLLAIFVVYCVATGTYLAAPVLLLALPPLLGALTVAVRWACLRIRGKPDDHV